MSATVRRINMVFLGCGAVTAAHSRRLAGFREQVRCFYASRDADKAASYESRFEGGGSFGSYEAALADGWMDVAFVATPPASHLELTLAALRAGKDVIVEKPAFLRIEDFDLVRSVAVHSGRRVFVAENYCYKPLASTLRAVLASGEIGDLRLVQVNALKRVARNDWRDDPSQAGGGALFEGGVHWIDLVAHLGPAVRAVQAFSCGPLRPASLERSLVVVLEYEGGAVGTLAHSWEIPSLFGLGLSHLRGTEGSITFESNGLFVLVRGRRRRLVVPGLRDLLGYRAMFADFLESLRTGREPVMTLDRARGGLELVEKAYRSAGIGPEVSAPSTERSSSWMASSRC